MERALESLPTPSRASPATPHSLRSAAPATGPEAALDAEQRKELLRFVVVGSVDDGKSTLIGRLLYETEALYEDQIAQVQRATRTPAGAGEIDFSLFTDGLKAEREQGITIDVAYRYFSTARRKFIVADTPGHAQYTRNMATGASTAELGVILLDARLGVLPQSRRHACIAALLGIPHLLVAVNKMDLVDFGQAVFERHVADFQTFAAGLRFASVTCVPVSARSGDNVVVRSSRTPWYRGPTLLELLETLPPSHLDPAAPLRLPVQHVLRPDLEYRGFAGQLAAGSVRPGSEVVILPSGRRTRVKAVDGPDGELAEAAAPLSIALRLEDEVDVSRGDLIASAEAPPQVARAIEATLVWLGEQPFDPTRAYLVKHTTRLTPVQTLSVVWRRDLESLREVATDTLAMNDIGRARLALKRPLMVDAYVRQLATGAFIVIDALSNATVAAGMIEQVLEAGEERSPLPPSQVGAPERRARLGHAGAIVALQGERERAAELAVALERRLFDAGVLAVVVESPEAARACAAGGLVALQVASKGDTTPSEADALLALAATDDVESAARRILAALGTMGC